MKKILICIMLFVISMIGITVVAYGNSVATVYCEAIHNNHENVNCVLKIRNNPGLAGFLFEINYDINAFELAGTPEASISAGNVTELGSFISSENENKGCKILWFNTQDIAADGVIANVHLKVLPNAPDGEYTIDLICSTRDTVNVNGEIIPIEVENSKVTIQGKDNSSQQVSESKKAQSDSSYVSTGLSADDVAKGNPLDNTTEIESNVKYTARFSDVPLNNWASKYINYLAEKGILNGKNEGLFEPSAAITRAEFVKILAAASSDSLVNHKISSFSDVKETAWFAPYVAWAINQDITKGYGDGKFDPDGNITREQMAAMLYRFIKYKEYTLDNVVVNSNFTDGQAISSYAYEAVVAMQKCGIINGYEDNSFGPKNNASRAETAKMMTVLLENVER